MKKHDPLAANRARVATAERELLAARDAMRSGAKMFKIPTERLFGDCTFVSRESAKSWVKDARREAHEEARERQKENIAALTRIADDRAAGKPSPFAHLDSDNFREWWQYQHDPSKCSGAYLQRRKALDKVINTSMALSKLCKAQGLEFSEVFGPGSLATPASLAMAERLIAGAQGRAAVAPHDDETDDVARQIVAAGRKRRCETDESAPFLRVVRDDEQPVVATPQAILRAAAKARGEIE
jgi:hypothetical protein